MIGNIQFKEKNNVFLFLLKSFMEIPYLAIANFHYDAKLLNHYQYQLINIFFYSDGGKKTHMGIEFF